MDKTLTTQKAVGPTSCGYIKITETEAQALSQPQESFSLTSVASAQGFYDSYQSENYTRWNGFYKPVTEPNFTAPFYILIFVFIVFSAILISIYKYHLDNYTLNEDSVKVFVPIYVLGFLIFLIPLLFKVLN